MERRYQDWITEKLKALDPWCACSQWTGEMAATFPELRRVRGHYRYQNGGGTEHWWCETTTGEIIDPTVSQFDAIGCYEEHAGAEPVGKCYNCGEYVWEAYKGQTSICCEECYDTYVAYLQNP